MDNDGTKMVLQMRLWPNFRNIPIIASGGAGNIQHFVDSFPVGKADAPYSKCISFKRN
jgi:cyclase